MPTKKDYSKLPKANHSKQYSSIEKLVKMLYLFQVQRYISKQKIIEELNISERTFYRYKSKLENIGIPFYSDANNNLTIDEGRTMLLLNRINLSNKEILSLIVANRLVENYSDRQVVDNFQSTMFKVVTGLEYAEKKDYFQIANENTTNNKKKYFNDERFPHTFLIDIQSAIVNKQTISIKYYTFHKDETTEREILPIELNFYRSMWHIRAFCTLREDYREFRLDRIVKLQVTSNLFDKEQYTIDNYIASKKISTPETEITVIFKNNIERLVFNSKHNFKIIDEKYIDRDLQITFAVDKYKREEFLHWIVMWGKNCELIEPQSVLPEIIQIVNEINDHYS